MYATKISPVVSDSVCQLLQTKSRYLMVAKRREGVQGPITFALRACVRINIYGQMSRNQSISIFSLASVTKMRGLKVFHTLQYNACEYVHCAPVKRQSTMYTPQAIVHRIMMSQHVRVSNGKMSQSMEFKKRYSGVP